MLNGRPFDVHRLQGAVIAEDEASPPKSNDRQTRGRTGDQQRNRRCGTDDRHPERRASGIQRSETRPEFYRNQPLGPGRANETNHQQNVTVTVADDTGAWELADEKSARRKTRNRRQRHGGTAPAKLGEPKPPCNKWFLRPR